MKESVLKTLLSVVFYVFCILSMQAQTLVYDALLDDKKVGELTVIKEKIGNVSKIHSLTEIHANIPFPVTVKLDVKSSYIDGVLIESKAITTHNGKAYSTINIRQSADGYSLEKNGNTSQLSTLKLVGADFYYFIEPTNSAQVIALASGDLYQIKTTTNLGEYIFVRGNKDEYRFYRNSVLQEMDVHHKLYTIELKLVR